MRSPSDWTNIVGAPLTDKKIAHYKTAGWYSDQVRQLRRERNAKRMAAKLEREGNFLLSSGRLIYNPLA
jgi:ethanolamine ammonia-lyase large subunit